MDRITAVQHDSVVQTLYSGRCGSSQALYFDYALAQARADVFFSLLFGGRIVCSAGMFFDSPIAIRVFGELFSNVRFTAVCERYDWCPLRLNSDNPFTHAQGIRNAKEYLLSRWRDPTKTFGLFREREDHFVIDSAQTIRDRKLAAARAVELDEYARLRNIYEPFLAEHRIPAAVLLPSSASEPQTGRETGMSGAAPALVSPVLTSQFAEWLRCILDYLNPPDRFVDMELLPYQTILSAFSPFAAVKSRTSGLNQDRVGNYDIPELCERNLEFERSVGSSPMMNDFHNRGPEIYQHYYALVNSWIEQDWHTTRHEAYGSATCLLSSNWEERQVFDFDAASKVHYLSDTRIDDSLRLTQERFGELDWSILFDVISDQRWAALIWKIRDATTREEAEAAADEIFDLLSVRITDFDFQSDKGRFSIRAKRITDVLSFTSTLTVCVENYGGSVLHMLGAAGVAVSSRARLKQPVTAGIVATVPGARWLHPRLSRRSLRTAIAPAARRLYSAGT